MLKRALIMITAVCCVMSCVSSAAQNGCGSSSKLYCLIPTALHTPVSQFNFFNTAFGSQLGQLPLATPASGFIFTFDKHLGVLTASSQSFGPIMTERAETIGVHKLYVAFTYQRFNFDDIDGTNLKNVPIVFKFQTATDTIYTNTQNRFDTKVDQYVGFASFGLTSRIDVSVAVPFERVAMGVSSTGTEYSTATTATASFNQFIPGSASGIGDVVLAVKGTAWKGEKLGLGVGAEVRLPSGDEQNFLGSGTFGIKPYVVLSRRGRIAPHVNLGYQWNGNSLLATDQSGHKQQLPTFFAYSGGADFGVSSRLTLVADFLGQRFFSAPQITGARNFSFQSPAQSYTFPTVEPTNGSYSLDNLGIGFKVNPIGKLLITGNVLIKLDEGGLRSKIVPLVGLSYTF